MISVVYQICVRNIIVNGIIRYKVWKHEQRNLAVRSLDATTDSEALAHMVLNTYHQDKLWNTAYSMRRLSLDYDMIVIILNHSMRYSQSIHVQWSD